jgi:hypothetical protein
MRSEEEMKAQVEALTTGRVFFDFLRKKQYTLEQCRTVAKAIYDGVHDETERLNNLHNGVLNDKGEKVGGDTSVH